MSVGLEGECEVEGESGSSEEEEEEEESESCRGHFFLCLVESGLMVGFWEIYRERRVRGLCKWCMWTCMVCRDSGVVRFEVNDGV